MTRLQVTLIRDFIWSKRRCWTSFWWLWHVTCEAIFYGHWVDVDWNTEQLTWALWLCTSTCNLRCSRVVLQMKAQWSGRTCCKQSKLVVFRLVTWLVICLDSPLVCCAASPRKVAIKTACGGRGWRVGCVTVCF